MQIFKTFFKVTDTVLDLTSVGTYSYILGRKFTETSYGKSLSDSSIGEQFKSSAGLGYNQIKAFSDTNLSPAVFEFFAGGESANCTENLKPNWVNFNDKIDNGKMQYVASAGLEYHNFSKTILGQTIHLPLAVPLAAIIDRDGNAHNDANTFYLALGITALDLGHWLTNDNGKDSDHEID